MDRQDLQQPDDEGGWRARLRRALARFGEAVAADTVAHAVVLGVAAALAFSGTYFGYVADLPLWAVSGMLGTALALTVPVAIGFVRSRQRREIEELKQELAHRAVIIEKLRRQIDRRAEADRMLADLFATLQGGDDLQPPAWAESPLAFERWLADFTREVIQVLIHSPDLDVGLALVRERDDRYELVHYAGSVPRDIVKLTGAPVRLELGDCIKRHAPLAVTIFGREIRDDRHWVVVFPPVEIDWPGVQASLDAASELLLAAYARYLDVQEA